jgi:hypothetical protein
MSTVPRRWYFNVRRWDASRGEAVLLADHDPAEPADDYTDDYDAIEVAVDEVHGRSWAGWDRWHVNGGGHSGWTLSREAFVLSTSPGEGRVPEVIVKQVREYIARGGRAH